MKQLYPIAQQYLLTYLYRCVMSIVRLLSFLLVTSILFNSAQAAAPARVMQGPWVGLYAITLANNTPITGPIALTAGLTLKVTISTNNNATPTWFWTRDNVEIPNTTGNQTLTITQAGRYYVVAATTPSFQEMYQQVDVFVPVVNRQPLNYATETTVLKPGTTANQLATLNATERSQTVTLADALGRPIQTIQRQATPTQTDLVSFQTYDAYGQSPTIYLPFAHTPGSASTPFSTSPVTEQTAFYNGTPKVATDASPVASTTIEASPLARLQQQTQPGNDWQTHAATQEYASNATGEVRRWTGLNGSNSYVPRVLSKETHQDADGRRSDIFRDRLGRVVLQRQWNSQVPHDTYTVYDDLGRVKYVIPPAAMVAAAANNYDLSDPAFMQRWLYQYEYDDQGRLSSRRFPDAAPILFVYDRFDRLVLTQDGNRYQEGKWYFTKYDSQGRPVVEGLVNDSRDQAALQADANNWTGAAYEQRQVAGIGYSTTNAFPAVTDGSNGTLLSATFYDDYDLDQDANAGADFTYRPQNLGAEEPMATAHTRGLVTVSRRRVITGNNTYGAWLTTANFYDTYGNLVQTQSNSLLATAATLPNVTTLVYREKGFVPQVLRSIKAQQSPAQGTIQVVNHFDYDATGRLLKVWQQNTWQNQPEREVLIANYAYNALGQLVEKNLHSQDDGATSLQSVDYRYDIQGNLISINNSALAPDGILNDDTDDIFGLELVRQATDMELSNTPRFDGGISAVRWQAHNPRQHQQPERQRSYRFTYDGLGRLIDATFAARDARSGLFTSEAGAYNENNITYDANGNIKSLDRTTQALDDTNTQQVIDQLTYTYEGNRLLTVTDAADTKRGFRDGSRSSQEYTYDATGSVTRDANKNVLFSYNSLNKVAVQTSPTGTTAYIYDAAGTVLRRTITNTQTSAQQIFDYVDGFVYTSTGQLATTSQYQGLLSVPTPEGRAVVLTTPAEPMPMEDGPVTSTPAPVARMVYEYHLRDQLGNLRVAFRAEALQERQALRMEDPGAEEGPYPAFEHVSSTQDGTYAYEGSYSAAVTAANPGPSTRIPVTTGSSDQVKVDFFYLTPAGVQYRPVGSAPKARRSSVALGLAPLLLPAPNGGKTEASTTARMWPGVQLSLSGLLSRRTIIEPAPVPAQIGGDHGPGGPVTITRDAYVAWYLYDTDNNMVKSGTAVVPVQTNRILQWYHFSTTIPLDKETPDGKGYLEVQLLNDGAQPVYFDSISIRHPKVGLLVSQENHYYPFGMSLKGVAINTSPAEQISKQQYNGGSELQDELLGDEAGIYSTFYRSYDPTIGRFQGIDPLAGKYAIMSPYSFAFNNPANYNDPTGADPPPLNEASMRLAMTIFNATPENGSAYWTPTLGGSFSNAEQTAFIYGLSGQEGSATFGGYSDGRSSVGAHTVKVDLRVTVIGKAPEQNYNAYNKTDAFIGFIGGIGEVLTGLALEPAAGVGTFLIIDGAYRIGLNGGRLLAYAVGSDNVGDNIPGNLGGMAGKVIDGVNGKRFDQTGAFQASMGLANDMTTFVASGGNGQIYVDLAEAENFKIIASSLASIYGNVTGFINNANSFKDVK